jgi:hypothetical protein
LSRWLKIGGIGCGGLLVLVIVIAVIAAAFGGGTQDTGTKEEQKAEPVEKNEPKEEAEEKAAEKAESSEVAVRVSGTQGVEYSGSYGTSQGQRSVDGALGAEPEDYEVDAQTGRFEFDVITATFQKRSPGPGTLRVEIVSEGEVVASQETTAEYGVANVSWSPQNP